jgi:hypothetical protein
MPALIVKLPNDRDFCGEIRLVGDDGAALAGPFQIAGRAAAGPAKEAGNPARSRLMRFGDTPTGRYKIRAILGSGAGTDYRQAAYGGCGIIVLDPCSGEAALAEANGRFHVFIQGGATATGLLCATSGALRVRDEDVGVLCALLGAAEGVECWCVEDAAMADGAAVADCGYDEGDPPPLIRRRSFASEISRRRMLAAGAMLSASPSLLLPGIFIAAEAPTPALAQNAYDQDNNGDQNNDNQRQPEAPESKPPSDQDKNDDNNTPKAY